MSERWAAKALGRLTRPRPGLRLVMLALALAQASVMAVAWMLERD